MISKGNILIQGIEWTDLEGSGKIFSHVWQIGMSSMFGSNISLTQKSGVHPFVKERTLWGVCGKLERHGMSHNALQDHSVIAV